MKKLFVSVPMRGRDIENIASSIAFMHKMGEVIFGQELELVDNLLTDPVPEDVTKESVYRLGHALQKMSTADYFIGVTSDIAKMYPGCATENFVAHCYGIPHYFINPKTFTEIEAFRDMFDSEEDPADSAN